MQNKNNKQKAFTIIETMIAVSLFLVVVMIGMGSLLNANLLHSKSQNMRSIIDNLSFIMEDMSNSLRTGYNYRCYPPGSPWNGTDDVGSAVLNSPQNCSSGGGTIVFEYQNGKPYDPILNDQHVDDQWVYFIGTMGSEAGIFRSTAGGVPNSFIKLNPDEIVITMASSSFTVTGAKKGGPQQPFVTIKLVGTINYKNVITPFSLQTSVSQRAIDI